jgi:hypothetical protein
VLGEFTVNKVHYFRIARQTQHAEGVGQEWLVEFRLASSRYVDVAWRENACCGIALVRDPCIPGRFSLSEALHENDVTI